jgi:hypothetical protein
MDKPKPPPPRIISESFFPDPSFMELTSYRIKKEYLFKDSNQPVYIPQKQNWLGFWVSFSYDESEPKSWQEWLHKKVSGPILYKTFEDAMKAVEDDRTKRKIAEQRQKIQYLYLDNASSTERPHLFKDIKNSED